MMRKSDINMLPKKEKASSLIRVGVPVAIIALIILVLAGIVLPEFLLGAKRKTSYDLRDELLKHEDVQLDYTQKLGELSALQLRVRNYESFISSGKETLDIMRRIDSIASGPVVILRQDYTYEKIVLAGYANTDPDIAAFEEALWDTNLFVDIACSPIGGQTGSRTFQFTLTYGAALQSGGEGE